MSEPRRIEGDRVYCHVCDHEWDRAQGGLQCPACASEFVEIIEPNSRPRPSSVPPVPHDSRPTQSPRSPNPFHNHHPWAPDPPEDDITHFEFSTRGGGGTVSFTSRTYTFGGGNTRVSRDIAVDDLGRNVEALLGNLLGQNSRRPTMMGGSVFEYPPYQNDRGFGPARPGQPPDLFSLLFQGNGPRGPNHPPTTFDLLGALFNPANARSGDTVFSQEAFDRIMTQLMEQNASNAPGPATDAAIAALEKKRVDEGMMGSDGKAECSICMDNVEIGDEVTVLPCNHWFHGECVTSWLKEHDTCPHCRKSTSNTTDTQAHPPTSPASPSRRRRISRRSSSATGALSPGADNSNRDAPFPDSPSNARDARQRYYSNSRTSDTRPDRPPRERQSSDRSQRSTDNSSSGGVSGWIRSRLPFQGQQ